jgi:hypothetical protein
VCRVLQGLPLLYQWPLRELARPYRSVPLLPWPRFRLYPLPPHDRQWPLWRVPQPRVLVPYSL